MLLGAARYLAENSNFDGTVHFIFQPAEEGLGGARAMIKDGLFERFPCDEVYALHNAPDLYHGEIAILPGPAMAGADFFDIVINGYGAHGAMPERPDPSSSRDADAGPADHRQPQRRSAQVRRAVGHAASRRLGL